MFWAEDFDSFPTRLWTDIQTSAADAGGSFHDRGFLAGVLSVAEKPARAI